MCKRKQGLSKDFFIDACTRAANIVCVSVCARVCACLCVRVSVCSCYRDEKKLCHHAFNVMNCKGEKEGVWLDKGGCRATEQI